MSRDSLTSTAVAIADLVDHDSQTITHLEGLLLVAASEGKPVVPAVLAREADLARETAANIVRQLEAGGAVTRDSFEDDVIYSPYHVDSGSTRKLLAAVRDAIEVIDSYRDRQPPQTSAEMLVTFPDDPSFEGLSPQDIGMSQLVSSLTSEAKRATDSIVLLAPFFEGSGLKRLQKVLGDAVSRGVNLTIVTRYLEDSESHNRAVLTDFLEYLTEKHDVEGLIRTVDYTVWDPDIPVHERTQDGSNPAFTLHAKVMLFDTEAVYVGSANITDYGFDRYLELGTLLRGPAANGCRSLVDHVLDSEGATTVQLPKH
jgi:putative cardiolipin synthase